LGQQLRKINIKDIGILACCESLVARAIERAQATTFDLLDLLARQCRHARRIIDRDASLNTLLL
jgi:hypothetical protein